MTFDIEWVPWAFEGPGGQDTYYKGINKPAAVVLHRMQGHYSTARAWALSGHYGASWHYSIDHNGDIMQHLEFTDGGYHAGIPSTAPYPTWPLWRGHGQNVNLYTIGIEMAGFAGEPHSPEQLAALKYLCKTLSRELGIPYDRVHFPPHADIDVVNRVNDFNTPAIREEVYRYLFEEDELSAQQLEELKALQMRRQLAALAADLGRYEEMKDTYRYAESKGYIKVVP